MWKKIQQLATHSSFDVIGQLNINYSLLKETKLLKITRSCEKEHNRINLQLSFRNVSKKPIKIYSAIVSEFYIDEEIKIKEVLEHGWQ